MTIFGLFIIHIFGQYKIQNIQEQGNIHTVTRNVKAEPKDKGSLCGPLKKYFQKTIQDQNFYDKHKYNLYSSYKEINNHQPFN